MTRRSVAVTSCVALFVLHSLAAGEQTVLPQAPSEPGQPGTGESVTVLLNESAWQRAYIQFGVDRISPSQLKSEEAAKLLGDTMNALKREVKQIHGLMGKKWDEATEQGGWMDDAYVLYRQGQAWSAAEMGRMNVLAATSPPPADWAVPEFDDGGWPRVRGSVMTGKSSANGWRDDLDELGRRAGYFRFPFEVPDPVKAGPLELNLVYHGGPGSF